MVAERLISWDAREVCDLWKHWIPKSWEVFLWIIVLCFLISFKWIVSFPQGIQIFWYGTVKTGVNLVLEKRSAICDSCLKPCSVFYSTENFPTFMVCVNADHLVTFVKNLSRVKLNLQHIQICNTLKFAQNLQYGRDH